MGWQLFGYLKERSTISCEDDVAIISPEVLYKFQAGRQDKKQQIVAQSNLCTSYKSNHCLRLTGAVNCENDPATFKIVLEEHVVSINERHENNAA